MSENYNVLLLKRKGLLSIKELTDRIKQQPHDSSSWERLGQVFWEIGDRDMAEKIFSSYGDSLRHRVDIEIVPYSEDNDVLLNFAININEGSQTEIATLDINGWVLGKHEPVQAVEIVLGDQLITRTPVCVPSHYAETSYPDVNWASNCGFRAMVYLLGMPFDFILTVFALFRDDIRFPLAKLSVHRKAISSTFQPSLQPLMITSIGRTGTTRLMEFLNEHPSIVIHSNYPYEARVLGYCFHMLKNHFEVMNLSQQVNPHGYIKGQFGFHHPGTFKPIGYANIDYQFHYWFNEIYTGEIIRASQKSIEDFYRRIASLQEKKEAIFFAEKTFPAEIPPQVWELYPKAKEIFLVRDFRDVVCSVLSFNRKREFTDFGRQCVKSDEEYISKQLKKSALKLLQSWKERADRAYLLHYERFILDPERVLREILEYLGLDTSPSIIEAILKKALGYKDTFKVHSTSDSPLSSIGRWKEELSPELQSLCNYALGEILHEFGYAEDNNYQLLEEYGK
ncbi:MAG TPA: sulfotransferase [Nitrospirae bacterium]|nr:sulfotransferase [Nitrospirota bacterium]